MILMMIMNLKMVKNPILWNRSDIGNYTQKNKNHKQTQI